MQLGTASKWPTEGSQSRIDPSDDTSAIQITRPFERGRGRHPESSPHPRYAFSISGCSPSIYQVVRWDEQAAYMNLLASHSLLQENPRPYPENVAALKRLKPFWSRGLETYGWAASDGPSKLGAAVLTDTAEHASANVPVDDDVDVYGVVVETGDGMTGDSMDVDS